MCHLFLKLSFFCVFVSVCRSEQGYLAKEFRDTIKTCCEQGKVNGHGLRSSNLQDCLKFFEDELPSSVPNEPGHTILCQSSLVSCCEDFIRKNNECEVGINYTLTSVDSCNHLNDTAKMCCNECRNGSQFHSHLFGCDTQLPTARDHSQDELLKVHAFKRCCQMDRCKITSSHVPHRCEHYCSDDGGLEVQCRCYDGYKLGADGKSCERN